MLKYRLQMFAEEAEGEMGVETDGVANQPESDKLDKAFAARLGHEKKKMEEAYSPYKSVIERQAKASNMSVEEYVAYAKEQQDQEDLEAEAEKQGKTPEQIQAEREKQEAVERLAKYERKEKLSEEEKTLVSDPKIGKFVSENLARIREIAEATDTDLQTGLAIVASELLPSLLEKADIEKQREIILKEYTESLKRGGKPIEIGGGASAPSSVTPKTFDEARASAIQKLKGV